jgi:adenylate cyclase, class 2
MTNIELKARCADFARIEECLNSLGAGLAGVFQQNDTYFRAPHGRLKLREFGPDEGQLIHYSRENTAGPKRSDYQIAHTSDPGAMRAMLSNLLGTWLEVEKTRQVWLWENVRIHLDEVTGLGRFLELEAVTEDRGVEESQARVEHLMKALSIDPGDLVAESYSDLVAQSRSDPVAGA